MDRIPRATQRRAGRYSRIWTSLGGMDASAAERKPSASLGTAEAAQDRDGAVVLDEAMPGVSDGRTALEEVGRATAVRWRSLMNQPKRAVDSIQARNSDDLSASSRWCVSSELTNESMPSLRPYRSRHRRGGSVICRAGVVTSRAARTAFGLRSMPVRWTGSPRFSAQRWMRRSTVSISAAYVDDV